MLSVHGVVISHPNELVPSVLRAVIETFAGFFVSPTQVATPSDRI
jgi:hypothetical protein